MPSLAPPRCPAPVQFCQSATLYGLTVLLKTTNLRIRTCVSSVGQDHTLGTHNPGSQATLQPFRRDRFVLPETG
jgi:hypothetical protein